MEWFKSLFGGNDNMRANDGPQPYMSVQDEWTKAQTDYTRNMMDQNSFGFNMNTGNQIMGGLNSLGQMYGAWQGLKLAKDQWKTQKSVLKTNMMNQIQSYNNSLKDRLDTRAHMEGRDQASADSQYEERKARRH